MIYELNSLKYVDTKTKRIVIEGKLSFIFFNIETEKRVEREKIKNRTRKLL